LNEADLMPLATQAVKALKDARAREGARLAEMLQDRIGQLRSLAEQAAPLLPKLVEQQRQRFIDRWNEAMALSDGNVSSDVAKTAPSPKPLPLPFELMWQKNSPAWHLTWTSSAASLKGRRHWQAPRLLNSRASPRSQYFRLQISGP
jgi:hypothetical protein